ncbi:MAG: hypothetical protein L6R40_008522 [Gallowayella cf. fulva]|nr:MAG: hypothetical protein L6R40_008522 [Xanthomendoza cf. fulva]
MGDPCVLWMAIFLLFLPFTLQVDITITTTGSLLTGNAIIVAPGAAPNRNSRTVVIANCPDIPPGECCQPPRHLSSLGSSVNFYNLHVTDIAAVWSVRPRMSGFRIVDLVEACSGRLSASQSGPGQFSWNAITDALTERGSRAAGASYITMPAALPPDPNISHWLMMEGLLGLVWGGGKWFSSPAAEKYFTGRNARRNIRSAKKGTVYARPPLRGRIPTFMEINGTKYSGLPAGDFMYVDDAGNTLNLTDWFVG